MRYRFVDCRFDLLEPANAEADYRGGHIPGARFLDLERDLSDLARAPEAGRHPLPSAERFAASASRAGIEDGIHVVAYDDGSLAGAARLWWLLRFFGHAQVSVLAGGVGSWLGELERGASPDDGATFVPRAGRGGTVTASDVGERSRAPGVVVLDARAPERYRGEHEPLDPVAGHVPGAINLPSTAAFTPGLPDDALAADELIVYCGSGVTACVVLLALALAGRPDALLYPGSWSEWSRLGLPVERG
ncbi:MAG: sulfurtransferase [Gaiellales bacterium]